MGCQVGVVRLMGGWGRPCTKLLPTRWPPNPPHPGSILLLLTGLTVTATVLCIIFFTPLILFTSPIWFPIGAFLFVVTAGFMSLCGFGVALVAGLSWIYRYFRGMHPPGSDRFDYARSRIYDTASHVKDYATQYGGYLQSKEKDAAPGA
ncbi:hypothetical protein CMV_007030 [Castanea mollissima]|uniref:Oleosin n=1 Tax=Castanea mollissima TaxID=60419 RepID=A0A8J4RNP2_9ROSI|nr:hypothetical protein CMV_007030 [Castanea mollissima]